ncbi:MAG: VOC family protein [Bacteroidota bacterium]|nr:VOC family protein [Bacteroidota bacterium]
METLTPNIFVKDMNRTIEFYTMLGFTVTLSVPEKGEYDWVMMTNGSVTMMFQTFANLGSELPDVKRSNGGSLIFYIKMKQIRSFFESIKGKVYVVQEIHKTFYGATEFAIKDCNDYILTFAEDE